jgi:5-exo-hydroxycamphor dehydrogenase
VSSARAAVLAHGAVAAQDVPVPTPTPGGVTVRVTLAGVCGSDVHIVDGHVGEMPFPIVLGHEGVGTLAELGAGVATDYAGVPVRAGDLVFWTPTARCGRCYSCVVLQETPCENASYFEDASKPNWGAHADYVWLPAGHPFFRVPDHVPAEALAALGCALPTAVRGNDRLGEIKLGQTVVVQGAGPVGIACLLVARASSAREIIVIDRFAGRLAMAERLGATLTLDLEQTTLAERVEAVRRRCGHNGPDVVLEAAGTLPAFPEGIQLGGNHGRYGIMGLWGATGDTAFPPRELSTRNLTVAGASFATPRNYFYAMQLVGTLAASLPLGELITHRYAIDDINDALGVTRSGEAVKAVIDTSL